MGVSNHNYLLNLLKSMPADTEILRQADGKIRTVGQMVTELESSRWLFIGTPENASPNIGDVPAAMRMNGEIWEVTGSEMIEAQEGEGINEPERFIVVYTKRH